MSRGVAFFNVAIIIKVERNGNTWSGAMFDISGHSFKLLGAARYSFNGRYRSEAGL